MSWPAELGSEPNGADLSAIACQILPFALFLSKGNEGFDKLSANGRGVKPVGEMIRMTMDDGAEIAVYYVQPTGERRGGLVLVQEIFRVTDHIRELCDEYAADGYEVMSPALFDREHPGFESDYSGPQFKLAVQLARELHPFELSLKDAQT